MTEKTEPQKVPGFSQGVRENAAVRTMKLVAPICPNSQIAWEDTPSGRHQKPKDPSAQNCQIEGGRWWLKCEERGHNPYFTTTVWYTKHDVVDPETNLVTGTERRRHEATRPNIVQVPISRRLHSGQGVVRSIERKGRRRLSEFGFEEVCQFRNCQKPIDPRARSKAFGDYCSPRHLQLIAADAQGEALQMVEGEALGFAPDQAERLVQRRETQLRQAGSFA